MLYHVLALFAAAGVAQGKLWDEPKPVGRLTVNLDLPPEDRYTELITNILDTHGWEYSYQSVSNYWDTLPSDVQDFMMEVSGNLENYFPSEYARELDGIAITVANLGYGDVFPLNEIVALNLLYEWEAVCTSIVAEDGEGNMWHARNMDWNFDDNSLYNISGLVEYQKGGVTVYQGVQWIAYVGVLSGSNEQFTFTVDQRFEYEEDVIRGNMKAIADGAWPVTQIARQALETCTSWDCATNTLATSYIAAPVYYIMGGAETGQGVVLTRDRHGNTTDWWKFGSGPQVCCPDIQDWYLLETNWDHWQLRGDGRQHAGITNMNNLGQKNVNADNLLNDVLYIPPTLAATTQYSMVTKNGDFSSFQVWGWQ
jgi:hypothetical protein